MKSIDTNKDDLLAKHSAGESIAEDFGKKTKEFEDKVNDQLAQTEANLRSLIIEKFKKTKKILGKRIIDELSKTKSELKLKTFNWIALVLGIAIAILSVVSLMGLSNFGSKYDELEEKIRKLDNQIAVALEIVDPEEFRKTILERTEELVALQSKIKQAGKKKQEIEDRIVKLNPASQDSNQIKYLNQQVQVLEKGIDDVNDRTLVVINDIEATNELLKHSIDFSYTELKNINEMLISVLNEIMNTVKLDEHFEQNIKQNLKELNESIENNQYRVEIFYSSTWATKAIESRKKLLREGFRVYLRLSFSNHNIVEYYGDRKSIDKAIKIIQLVKPIYYFEYHRAPDDTAFAPDLIRLWMDCRNCRKQVQGTGNQPVSAKDSVIKL